MTTAIETPCAPVCPPWCGTEHGTETGWDENPHDWEAVKRCCMRVATVDTMMNGPIEIEQFASVTQGKLSVVGPSVWINDKQLTHEEAKGFAEAMRKAVEVARSWRPQ